MKKYLLYIVPIFLLVFSCKKKALPTEPDSGTPVFYTSCNVNGISLRFDAGINNYYMSSSHSQDVNGVYVYKADLKQTNCNGTCSYGISFLINDIKSSLVNAKMYPDSALFLGEHPFNDGNLPPLGFYGKFESADTNTGTTYRWSIGTNTILTGQTYTSFAHYFPTGKTYSVSSNVDNQFGNSSQTNVFKVGYPLQNNISAQFQPSLLKYYFAAAPSPSLITACVWNFGDGSPLAYAAVTDHIYSGIGDYPVSCTVTSGTNTCVSHYKARVDYDTKANPNFTNSFVPVPNSKALTAITMQVTDFNTNTVYSSANMDQPTGNKFEIVSVEDYNNNEVGDATKKVKIKFNCKVKSGNDIIDISNGEAVIAVSYKN